MYTLENLPSWSPQQRRGKETLYAFFRKPWDKKQTSIDLGVATESQARVIGPFKILEYLNREDPTLRKAPINEATVPHWIQEFLKDEYIHQKENTKRGVRSVLRRFEKHAPSKIADITWEFTRDYLNGCKESYEVKGLDIHITILAKLMRYLVGKGLMTDNHAAKYPRPASFEFHVNEITWETNEFLEYYNSPYMHLQDKDLHWVIWNTGIDLADWFFLRKRHIEKVGNRYLINKLREKATSPWQRIQFPLDNCPAKDVLLSAWAKAKNPDDRLHAIEYKDEDYRQFQWSLNTRRWRTWRYMGKEERLKTLKQLRHTFVTQCVSGERFGIPIPQHVLELWMGWRPGSHIGARIYTHVKGGETAKWMLPPEKGIAA